MEMLFSPFSIKTTVMLGGLKVWMCDTDKNWNPHTADKKKKSIPVQQTVWRFNKVNITGQKLLSSSADAIYSQCNSEP